ncbi:MAG: hypothetical protein MUO23_05390 [Anaerolineales bacterium]|nr:hypothetical protein [Anaerolineales bacterium]
MTAELEPNWVESYRRAQQVREQAVAGLLRKENVVGVGVGMRLRQGRRTKEVVLVVMVDRKVPLTDLRPADVIPSAIDGVPVDVQETGEFSIHT